jgi:hypothetical protein
VAMAERYGVWRASWPVRSRRSVARFSGMFAEIPVMPKLSIIARLSIEQAKPFSKRRLPFRFSQFFCYLEGRYCLNVFPLPMKFPTRETDHRRMIRSAVSMEAIATAGTHLTVQGINKIKGT